MKYFCKNFWQTSFHLSRKHYLCTPNYDVTKEFDVLLFSIVKRISAHSEFRRNGQMPEAISFFFYVTYFLNI